MDRQALQERFGIIGDSPALRRVLDRVRHVAPVDIAVLIEGESGVGKELVATAIHETSRRRHRKLVVVNCGAIPEGLIESELFGAEKGAYTGSVERRTGFFEEADGGTIFLDEIGEMPLQAQVRLLRVLETGQFSRVGSSQTQTADARVVAATNKDLGREVREGRFREDLYYRLSTVVIRIPPLRERTEDVLPTFEQLLYRAAQRFDAPLRRLTTDAKELLVRYPWPGNVREMRNVAEQAAVLVQRETASAEDLRPFLRGVSATMGLMPAPQPAPGTPGGDSALLYRTLLELRVEMREIRAMLAHLAGAALEAPFAAEGFSATGFPAEAAFTPAPEPHPGFVAPDPFASADRFAGPFAEEAGGFAFAPHAAPDAVSDAAFRVEDDDASEEPDETASPADALRAGPLPTMEEAERLLIAEALRRFGGNRRQSARALGISERTLYRKIKDLDEETLGV